MIVIEFEENKYGNINRRKEVIFMYGDWMHEDFLVYTQNDVARKLTDKMYGIILNINIDIDKNENKEDISYVR